MNEKRSLTWTIRKTGSINLHEGQMHNLIRRFHLYYRIPKRKGKDEGERETSTEYDSAGKATAPPTTHEDEQVPVSL